MKALAISGHYPCVRAGKIAEAMLPRWQHDALCRAVPPQFADIYGRVTAIRGATRTELGEAIRSSDADLLHVHNEPNWAVTIAKENSGGRPVVMNVHDVTSARPNQPFDPEEEAAYADADAFVFVTKEQRAFCIAKGFSVEGKPFAILGNWASASSVIDKPVLEHIGGVVYAGGLDPRGSASAWRDLSPVADMLGADFHIYPGNPGVDYGTVHGTVLEYRLLTHRLAQHDWGFSGTPVPNDAWSHAIPNKVAEYLMAGIPILALNNDPVRPICEEGLGIYLHDLRALPMVLREADLKAFRKNVVRERYRYTMSYNIGPVEELFGGLVA